MRFRWLWALGLFFSLAGCDQATKRIAETELREAAVPLVDGFFELTYVENRDVGFSLLRSIESDDARRTVIVCFGIGALALMGFLIARAKDKPWGFVVGLSLIAAGAAGNLVDRLTRGYVVDFFHVYFQDLDYPVFNVADIAVLAGAIVLAWKGGRAPPKRAAAA
jgi:signal peptidase II